MLVFWILLGTLAGIAIGVLADWLLKPFLPARPALKHIIAGLIAIVVLVAVIAFSLVHAQSNPMPGPTMAAPTPTMLGAISASTYGPMATPTMTSTPATAGLGPPSPIGPSALTFADGCINPEWWNPYAEPPQVFPKDGRGCWSLIRAGMSAEGGNLQLLVTGASAQTWIGIYRLITQTDPVYRLALKINTLKTPNTPDAVIAIGLINLEDPPQGTFLYFHESEKSYGALMETGASLTSDRQNLGYHLYARTDELVLTLSDLAVSLSIPEVRNPLKLNASFPKRAFFIGYRVIKGSNIDASISGIFPSP